MITSDDKATAKTELLRELRIIRQAIGEASMSISRVLRLADAASVDGKKFIGLSRTLVNASQGLEKAQKHADAACRIDGPQDRL